MSQFYRPGFAGLVSISAACHFSARRVVGMDLDSGLIEAAEEHLRSLGGAPPGAWGMRIM
jgi:predicted RNA methylase